MKNKILVCLLTLSTISAAPAAVSQTAPDYAAIVATPDRSDADRKLDTNRAPAQWLAFIGAKPGMKILDIFAVFGWKAELLARAVAPDGKVYAQNSEAAFARVKDRLDARLKTSAAANIVSVVRPFEEARMLVVAFSSASTTTSRRQLLANAAIVASRVGS